MGSIFPVSRPDADSHETRRLFMRWLEVQEEDFPLADPTDTRWKDRFRTFFEAAVHPDVVVHGVPLKNPGRAGWLEFLLSVGQAYPDGQTTYETISVDGDIGAAYWTYRATHRGDFGAHATTGKALTIVGAMFDRFENGLLVEHWAVIDQLSWLKQLGALPNNTEL